MNPTLTHEHFQVKKNTPELRAGDRVRVHQKIREGSKERVQIFEGLVIKTAHGNGINGTFTVRRISLGVGVEKTFPLHLPTIVKIEKIKSASVRRANLFYVRDLIGKRANRLKKEKEDKAVWEDVVAVDEGSVNLNMMKDPEQEQIEREAEEAKASKEEVAKEEKTEVAEAEEKKEEPKEEKTEVAEAPEETEKAEKA